MRRYIRKTVKTLEHIPVVRAPFLLLHRSLIVASYFTAPAKLAARWLFRSREHTNFTYDLTDSNKAYLAAFVSEITGCLYADAMAYIRELERDDWLAAHLRRAIEAGDHAHLADKTVYYGRRLGWYAFIRATKPSVVIETGVDKGLGSCVIARALQRNLEEGHAGSYYGTDINPQAGYLFTGELTQFGKILYGDSIESLRQFSGRVDLFINDSDHSGQYERAEYEEIAPKLNAASIILGDNAHVTNELFEFSQKSGRSFLFFPEKPSNHWYPGGGIGVSFRRNPGEVTEMTHPK